MMVNNGVLIVMRLKKTTSNIYKLLGNTVVGYVASVESDNDATKLYNMCLGYLSERGMMELHKINLLKEVRSCKLEFCKYYTSVQDWKTQNIGNFKLCEF